MRTEQLEALRNKMGLRLLLAGLGFLTISIIIGTVIGKDTGEIAQSAFQDLAMTIVAFGIGIWAIDPALTKLQKEMSKQEKLEELKEDIVRRMRSSIPGIAARASEEIQENGFRKYSLLKKNGFTGANWSGVRLLAENLEEIDLEFAKITNADLRWCNFSGGSLMRSSFKNSDLTDAKFTNADVSEVNFENTHLDGVDFSGAYMEGASLKGATIHGVSLGWDGTEEIFHQDGGTEYGPTVFSTDTKLPDGKMWTEGTDMSVYTKT